MLRDKLNTRLLILMVYVALCSVSHPLYAQYGSYDYTVRKSAWIKSENPAGIALMDTSGIAFAEIAYNKSLGKFVNYYESDNSDELEIQCESYKRLSGKTVVFGKILYQGFTGKNMGASSVIDPGNTPFDLVEYADSTAGVKNRETYLLEGTLSTKLNRRMDLGFHASYKNVSYYKTRDLRHTNDLMDLTLQTGMRYAVPFLEGGLMYAYRRSTEGLTFQMNGNKNEQYNTLINFGAFFGLQERFGENGYTESSDTKPFVDEFHSIGLQFLLFPQKTLNCYQEVSATLRNGYYGKNSTTSVRYTSHQANILHYKGILSYKTTEMLHRLTWGLDAEKLINEVNVYKEQTTSGGNTVTRYFGKNKVLNRRVVNLQAIYQAYWLSANKTPEWIASISTNTQFRNSTTTIYPAYRKQGLTRWNAGINIARNIKSGPNTFSFFAGLEYGQGSGYAARDGLYSASSSADYATLDRYLKREYEYLTSARTTGNAGFRYSRQLHKKGITVYTELSGDHTQAFNTSYTGNTRELFCIRTGCLF